MNSIKQKNNNILSLLAELQKSPSLRLYNKISLYYKTKDKIKEHEAFEELIKIRYGNSSLNNTEQ